MDIEEIRKNWRQASDRDVVEAASIDKDGYRPEVQAIIQNEVERRDLAAEVRQKMAKFRERAERIAKKRAKRSPTPLFPKVLKVLACGFGFFISLQVAASLVATLHEGGYPTGTSIQVVGWILMPVVVLAESKYRLGRCAWGWAIGMLLFFGWNLEHNVSQYGTTTRIAAAFGQLTAMWIIGIGFYVASTRQSRQRLLPKVGNKGTLADELDVLRVCLASLPIGSKQVVSPMTTMYPQYESDTPDVWEYYCSYLRAELQDLQEETLTDFLDKNKKPYPLEPEFTLNGQLVCVTSDSWTDWEEFRELYPESHGYVSFSRAGFNSDVTQALVYAGGVSDFLSGHGQYSLFTKSDSGWAETGNVRAWVS